ncbi:MAG: ATP-binding protein [Gammaproteobacteria bacterium]
MTPAPGPSLRRRLAATLLGGMALAWIVAAGFTVARTRAELGELLDAHLAQSTAMLIAQVGHEVEEMEEVHAPDLHKYARNVAFQVWSGEGRLMLHSADAPDVRLSAVDEGYSDTAAGGRRWRVYSRRVPDSDYVVQVAELREARAGLARTVLGHLLLPLAAALPLLGLAISLAVGVSLRPLRRVSGEIARRDPKYLEPIRVAVPEEIAPVVAQLNALLARVSASLEGERRFTSDAAHELRTPLAGIRAQLQVAQGAAADAERARAIAQALAACDRLAHLVQQMLTLARLEHDAWQAPAANEDLHALAAAALIDAASAAETKGIALALEGTTARAPVHAALWAVLLRNLLDNAIAYSPSGTTVTVTVARTGQGADVAVCDQGPGIAAPLRAEALQRFRRLDDHRAPGSGLGLSIVARIAELHGASLTLADAPGGGLCAQVRLPATPG